MNIGFDLDKIFINFPPLIPPKVIDLLYKEKTKQGLKYRIPSRIERSLRILSHHPFLRSPITKNLDFLKKNLSTGKNNYYLISSRFDFLKDRTDDLIKRYDLDRIFKAMYFNYLNKQPHEFKNEILEKLKLDMYADDDLQLLEYLADKNPRTKFFWLNDKINKILKKNIFAIKHISEMFK